MVVQVAVNLHCHRIRGGLDGEIGEQNVVYSFAAGAARGDGVAGWKSVFAQWAGRLVETWRRGCAAGVGGWKFASSKEACGLRLALCGLKP